MVELEPLGAGLEPRARGFVSRMFGRYADAASKRGDFVKAQHFREVAERLG